jgi:hypothetical protein
MRGRFLRLRQLVNGGIDRLGADALGVKDYGSLRTGVEDRFAFGNAGHWLVRRNENEIQG